MCGSAHTRRFELDTFTTIFLFVIMAAILISTVPNFVSLEEHKTIVVSTPSSFSDIPPVLRYKEESVSVILEPTLEGFSEEDGKEGSLYVLDR